MKTAFIFSGQGAQHPGMMQELVQRYPSARKVFEIADEALGRSVSMLCSQGTPEELALTHNTQPCMLAADLVAWAALTECGVQADGMAGFSLGEYAALVAAGVLKMDDAFRVVQLRADAMQAAVPIGEGTMAAVMRLTPEEVETLCEETEGYVIAANYNAPAQTVVSGEASAVERLLETARERKIRCVKLAVSAPFHCKLMEPAALCLRQAFETISFQKPRCPIFLNMDGRPEVDPQVIRRKLVQQAMSPVRWTHTLLHMRENGITHTVELGPGSTLTGFVKKTTPELCALHVENLSTLNHTLDTLRGERI